MELETARDALRVKWLRRKKLIALMKARKERYQEWLTKQPAYEEFKGETDAIKDELSAIEVGMDQDAALGEQGDFLVSMDRENLKVMEGES
jgi:hypothetical protein